MHGESGACRPSAGFASNHPNLPLYPPLLATSPACVWHDVDVAIVVRFRETMRQRGLFVSGDATRLTVIYGIKSTVTSAAWIARFLEISRDLGVIVSSAETRLICCVIVS